MKITEAKNIITATSMANLDILSRNEGRAAQIIVPYLVGNPGLGKTTIVQQAAAEIGANVIVLRLSEYMPSEVGGWNVPDAEREFMRRVRPHWLAHAGDQPIILFLDELPQAATSVQNVAARIVNEREVGDFRLPDNMVIVCAGNPTKSRAGTNHMPTHLRDRMTYIEVEADMADTVAYFHKVGVDPRVSSYLRFQPEQLSKFETDADACPSPRSWERVSTLINLPLDESLIHAAVAGQIGPGAATDFMAFLRVAGRVPDVDAIIKSPDTAPIPSDLDVMFALAGSLATRMNQKNAKAIMTYLNRLTRQEIAASVILDAIARDRTLIKVDDLRKWFVKVGHPFIDSNA